MNDRKERKKWKWHLKPASYLIVKNSPSPAPSSQSIRLEMADAGVLDHLTYLFFARTRDVANLVLTNENFRLHGLSQRVTSFFPNMLRKTSASLPSSPSHDTTNGVKWCRCSRHGSRYFFLFLRNWVFWLGFYPYMMASSRYRLSRVWCNTSSSPRSLLSKCNLFLRWFP